MQIDITGILLQSIWTAIKVLWPYLLLVAIVGLFRLIYGIYRFKQIAKSGILEIDKMDGTTFEKYLISLFEKLGFNVEWVGRPAGDFGADLIIQKNDIKTAVQAKRHDATIGVKAIQEVNTAKNHYNCTQALVVTNNYFTNQAKQLAKESRVDLWNRNDLIRTILQVNKTVNVNQERQITS
jgi:restriction system protein